MIEEITLHIDKAAAAEVHFTEASKLEKEQSTNEMMEYRKLNRDLESFISELKR